MLYSFHKDGIWNHRRNDTLQTNPTNNTNKNTWSKFLSQDLYLYVRVFVSNKLCILEEDISDWQHGILIPLVVPVDGTAVDKGGVHAAPLAEPASRGAQGQHDMKVGLHTLDEVAVHSLGKHRNSRYWVTCSIGLYFI